MAEEQKAKYEIIYDMGTELYIAKVQLAELKEQDINARIMKNEMQDQLTANIKNRGQLESLPLIALMGEKLEIISGHHRVKSAREAGLKEIIVILDKSGLTRSKAASKQLAHNAISGFDDESTLREIVKLMDNVDDMMESYIGKEILEEPLEQFDKLNTPAVQFDFKTIAFAFLPNQIRDLDALMKNLNGSCAEIIGVAAYEQCEKFVETLDKYQQFTDIRNVGAAVHSMIDAANEKMDDAGFDPDMDWTYLAKVFGSAAIPVESAEVIKKALKKAEKDGTITSKNKWQIDKYAEKAAKGELLGGYNYEHFNIFENINIPKQRIAEIVSQYDKDSIWYIRDIEGKRSIAEGLIYVKLATSIAAEDDEYIVPLEETIDMAKRGEFIELNIGVDFGGNGSGHAFVASGITQGYEKLYVLSSEWHDADGTDPDDLNRMFMKFVEKILDRYGFITNVYCDSAELVLKRGLQKAMIEAELGNINVTNAAKCKITDRIFTMTTLSATGRVFFTPDCESVLEAISMAVWNPKKMELERLDDGTSDIDSLDAMEYSFEKRIKKFIKKTG